ncbi:MAG: PHP domain-containing protein [Anaerolineae bacterium]|nr:PHP domain-containing protein [Anaerolineae bacterium]
MTATQQLTLEYLIQPAQTFTYINRPFEVPPHTGRIDVSYTYEGAISSDPTITGGNTVDIGIIDPRGAHFMTPGFRGWSGSARQQFYIAQDSATPGYMPGPIQPGTWHICLGAYKVAANGCHCQINITLTPASQASAEFPTLLPVRTTTPRPQNADGWYKGELHCHTVHSDGDTTPEEVIQIAQSLGLDFLAITDHNNRSHLDELARLKTDLILIPGYEVTTYYGHWNIWGDGAWIDFRIQSPDDLRRAIAEAQRQGYLVSCNHPRPYGPQWAFPEVDGYSCVEVWNGPWELLNDQCLAFWEARINQGQKLVAVGGSDFHVSKQAHVAHLAHPTVYVYCPDVPSPANLLRHLRAGHAFISESPTGPRLDLRAGTAMMGDALDNAEGVSCILEVNGGAGAEAQISTAAGIVARFPIAKDQQTCEYRIPTSTVRYVRAQLVDPISKHYRALTNPIYLSGSIISSEQKG